MIKKNFYQWFLKKVNENTVSFLTVNNLLLVFAFLVCGIVLICFSLIIFGWAEESRNFLTGFVTIFSILIATTTAMITFISKSDSETVDTLHRNFSILRWSTNTLELNKKTLEHYNAIIDCGIPQGSKIFLEEFRISLKKIQKILEDDKFINVVNVEKYKTIVDINQLAFGLIVDIDYFLLNQNSPNNQLASEKRLQQTKEALELIIQKIETLKQDIKEESGKLKKLILKTTKTNFFFKDSL